VTRKEALLVGWNIFPGGDRRIAIGEPGARRYQSDRNLVFQARSAHRIPTGVVVSAVFPEICFFGLQWSVHGVVRDIKKKSRVGSWLRISLTKPIALSIQSSVA
jgi:hypothetical protein